MMNEGMKAVSGEKLDAKNTIPARMQESFILLQLEIPH